MGTAFLDPTALVDGVTRLGLGRYEDIIRSLEECPRPIVTDVYALQQVVYRHHLVGDADHGYHLAARLKAVVEEVFSVTERDLVLARWIGEDDPRLEARERLHLAVIRRHSVGDLVTGVPERYHAPRGVTCMSIRALLPGSEPDGHRGG